MLNVIEVGPQVNVNDSRLALHNCLCHPVHRLMRSPFRTVSVRPRLEISFEDRLQNELECPLDHTITDGRDGHCELHWTTARIWDGLRSVTRSIRCEASASKYSRSDAYRASIL